MLCDRDELAPIGSNKEGPGDTKEKVSLKKKALDRFFLYPEAES